MPRKSGAAAAAARESAPAKSQDAAAVPFVDALNGAKLVDVPVTDIDLANASTQFRLTTRIEDLRPTIEREGQTDPVDLFGSKPYRIIDGFRRVQAIKELGWPTVKAVIHRDISEAAAHERAFVMNVVRRNLTAMDRANAIRLAKKRGLKGVAIAAAFGLSEKQLARYEALLDFAPAIRGLLDADDVSMAHAKLLNDSGVSNAVEWAERIHDGKWSATQLRHELRKHLSNRKAAKARPYIQLGEGACRVYARRLSATTPIEECLRAIAEYERLISALRSRQPERAQREHAMAPKISRGRRVGSNEHATAAAPP